MKESVVTFGPLEGLVGIVTEPASGTSSGDRPAVILLNAGFLHRAGPFRLYVELARKVASMGFLTLRFDLSGLGDSLTRKDNKSDEERTLLDVQEAMDYLTARKGIKNFVLMGLCAGADRAYPVAVVDPRVQGVVFFDGFGYRNFGFYLIHLRERLGAYAKGIFVVEKWKRLFAKIKKKIFKPKPQAGAGDEGETYIRVFPARKKLKADMEALLDRGCRLFFIYTLGIEYYKYEKQFADTFGTFNSQKNLRIEFFPEADHLFSRLPIRMKMLNVVGEWMTDPYRDLPGDSPESSTGKQVE